MASFKVKKPPLVRSVVFDGYDYGLRFPFLEGASQLLQSLGGSFVGKPSHPLRRSWRIPKAKLDNAPEEFFESLMLLAQSECKETFQSFIQKLELARQNPIPEAFFYGMEIHVYPLTDGGALSVGDYHPCLVALFRSLQGVFLPPMKGWRLNASLETLHFHLISLGFKDEQIILSDVKRSLHCEGSGGQAAGISSLKVGGESPAHAGEHDEGVNEIYLADVPEMVINEDIGGQLETELAGFSLYDYQRQGVRFLVTRNSALLADDMGLGKTRQAVVAATLQARGGRILIVTLASLIINFQREIHAVQPDATVSLQADDPQCQWVVVNYERLKSIVPVADQFAVMVIDEAHRLKEPSSDCTKHAFDIAARVPIRYLLTGTPVLNRETELHTLLKLSGHPIGQLQLRDFCEQFAGSSTFRQTLRDRLSDWMLRRRKDVLPELKGKQRCPYPYEICAGTRASYQEILGSSDTPLVRLGKLRKLLETAKVDAVVARLAELGADDKAIVFCEFRDTVSVLEAECKRLGVMSTSVLGHHSATRRQVAVDEFQSNPDCRVFIGTTNAAGTGINLTAANYVFFCSLPWTPAKQAQAEDRAFRNGQLRPVFVLIPLVESSIDQQLWQMLLEKQALASDLLEPEGSAEQAMQALAGVA